MGRGSLIKHAIPTCELHKGGLKKKKATEEHQRRGSGACRCTFHAIIFMAYQSKLQAISIKLLIA